MSGNKLFLDTNIILYLLGGDETLSIFLNQKQFYISIITEMEILGYGGLTKKEESIIREFLSQCKILPINNTIKEETIRLRKQYKTKLPDSIIIATCLYLDLPLITSDLEFKKVDELTLIHYEQTV